MEHSEGPLGALAMDGPYPLTHTTVDEMVTRMSPGNYALGHMIGAEFEVLYVGHSASDVRRRLHEWVGLPSRTSPSRATPDCQHDGLMPLSAPEPARVGSDVDCSYSRFAYSYAPSAEVPFEQEWRNCEDLGDSGKLDSEAHPLPAPRSSGGSPGALKLELDFVGRPGNALPPMPLPEQIPARSGGASPEARRRVSPRVSLSGLDAAFLSLETRSTPMNVVATFVLDVSNASDGYSYARVLRMVEARLPELAPFRRRLVAMPFGVDFPVWIDDPDFRIRSHVHRVGAPAPGSDQALADLVAQIAAQPLDRTRPLWELWVVEGLTEGRVALVFKLHHAVADGVSAAQLLQQLFDPSLEGAEARDTHERMEPAPAPTSRALLGHALSRLPTRSLQFARLLRVTAGSLAAMARSRLGTPEGKSRMPMPFSAPRMPWNGATSPQRTVAYGRARLADVKRVKAVFGATVNHVILAACTQTLRKYLEAHGGVPQAPLVAAIPVSLRSSEEVGASGNRISAFLVHLPVHLADPVAQLLAVRDGAQSSRQLHTAVGASALGEWAEFTSTALLAGAARFYSERKLAGRHRPIHNLVISNVRGPGTPLYAAGARVTAAYPLGPLMEGAGMNITVASYMDSVDFGVIACERSVPQVASIALGFGTAVADLLELAIDKRSGHPSVNGAVATPDFALASATGR